MTHPAQVLDTAPQGRLIEVWFSLIERQAIHRGTFASALIHRP